MRLLVSLSCALVLFGPPAASAAPGDPYLELQWGLRAVRAERAWTETRGAGSIVAIVDTGVDGTHPDLRGRVMAGRDFVDDDGDASDENGHGTLIAGIVAAAAGNGVGGASVAPGARILPVRVLDRNGTGSSADVGEGIRWATSRGADVINLSLATEAPDGLLQNLLEDPEVDGAIRDAASAGATVVIAAGNDHTGGTAETAYDATVPGVLVVGATAKDGRRAAYSNFGDGLDLVAPGGGSSSDPRDRACSQDNGIVSTWWNPRARRSGYGAGCGTSMAVAFVSGGAALLHAQGRTNAQVARRLVDAATDVGRRGRDEQTGGGLLNAARAVGAPAADPAPSPAVARPTPTIVDPPARTAASAVTGRARPRATEPSPYPSVLGATILPSPPAFAFGGARGATDTPRDDRWPATAAAVMISLLVLAHAARVLAGPAGRRRS